MNFTKTTLAVACGIILVPILICGGCFMIGAVGTTAVVSTGVGVADAVSKAMERQRAEAEAMVEEDKERFLREQAEYEKALEDHRDAISRAEDAERLVTEWKADNPRPSAPAFERTTWWSLDKQSSIEATLVNVNETAVKLEKDDESTVVVPLEKLDPESRALAKGNIAAMEKAKEAAIQWDQASAEREAVAVAARNGVPEVPTEPSPIITEDEAIKRVRDAVGSDAPDSLRPSP